MHRDIAILDEHGYGKITGRIKDMIIRGGENIYPLDVEQVLYKHPKVEDVQVGHVTNTGHAIHHVTQTVILYVV